MIIEGDFEVTWQTPFDIIDIQNAGISVSSVIEIMENPLIEWIFDTYTTYCSTSPSKDYGSIGVLHNLLKVNVIT